MWMLLNGFQINYLINAYGAFCAIKYIFETNFNVIIDNNDMVMNSSTDDKISYDLIFIIHFEHFNKLQLVVKNKFVDEN